MAGHSISGNELNQSVMTADGGYVLNEYDLKARPVPCPSRKLGRHCCGKAYVNVEPIVESTALHV
jgi:hypothetical protein